MYLSEKNRKLCKLVVKRIKTVRKLTAVKSIKVDSVLLTISKQTLENEVRNISRQIESVKSGN